MNALKKLEIIKKNLNTKSQVSNKKSKVKENKIRLKKALADPHFKQN